MLAILVSLATVAFLWLVYQRRMARAAKIAAYFPHPKPVLPLLGNSLMFANKDAPAIFHTVLDLHKQCGQDLVTYGLFGDVQLHISSPKAIERVLLSKVTKKNYIYEYLEPWLGTGLLLSFGEKWFQRRKIITPTFHFKILEQFLEVFNAETDRLVTKIEQHVGGEEFDMYQYITLHALDSICETSMGVSINALDNPDNAYVHAIKDFGSIVIQRTFSALRSFPLLYFLHPFYWRQQKLIKTMHNFTNSVIKAKRQALEEKRHTEGETKEHNEDDGIYGKKRMSFLDLLLNESSMSDADIREEVDTFMFEGHDTTTSGIYFSLMALAMHPDIQERLYGEIRQVLETEEERHAPLTNATLQQMKYLDMVIKEVLRVYPSVPIIGRELLEDVEINGCQVPRGTAMVVIIHNVHRNAEVFPDPERFDPERFSDESGGKRGPYDYIPFSVGARNCIGQKYALLEMKVTLVKLLLAYRFIPGKSTDSIRIQGDLVLRPFGNMALRIESR